MSPSAKESTHPVACIDNPTQPKSHSCSATQTEPRAAAFAAAIAEGESTRPFSQIRVLPDSSRQIELRVAAIAAVLAAEREQEAAAKEGQEAAGEEEEAGVTSLEDPTIEEITALLTNALPSVPDARLIIASSRYPDNAIGDPSIVVLSQTAKNRVTFGVIQGTRNVDFYMRLPFDSRSTSVELVLQIIYDPGSDDCLLVNRTSTTVCLTSHSSSPPHRARVEWKGWQAIQPGMWRVSVGGDEGDANETHLAEFLLLGRQFTVSIYKANDAQQEKRAADDDAGGNPTKRQRLENNRTEVVQVQSPAKPAIDLGPVVANTDGTENYHQLSPSSVREMVNKAAIPILDLTDGETAVIQTASQPENATNSTDTYQLRRVKYIGATLSTSVFACRHSKVSGTVVAKVPRHAGGPVPKLASFAEVWKREDGFLEKISHVSLIALPPFLPSTMLPKFSPNLAQRNIVSLLASDARMLVMYLEPLPSSLFRGLKATYEISDIHKILYDISSALSYLAAQPIIHNDIKPFNITYSPSRGAVLIDFGMATHHENQRTGGSPWYLPPEFRRLDKRGPPGDVWSLGITMLYVLGNIELPERIVKGWPIHGLSQPGDSRQQMKGWLDFIARSRAELHQVDGGGTREKIEYIVFNMLEEQAELRIKAESITAALDALALNSTDQPTISRRK